MAGRETIAEGFGYYFSNERVEILRALLGMETPLSPRLEMADIRKRSRAIVCWGFQNSGPRISTKTSIAALGNSSIECSQKPCAAHMQVEIQFGLPTRLGGQLIAQGSVSEQFLERIAQ